MKAASKLSRFCAQKTHRPFCRSDVHPSPMLWLFNKKKPPLRYGGFFVSAPVSPGECVYRKRRQSKNAVSGLLSIFVGGVPFTVAFSGQPIHKSAKLWQAVLSPCPHSVHQVAQVEQGGNARAVVGRISAPIPISAAATYAIETSFMDVPSRLVDHPGARHNDSCMKHM
jgi:hypothetical protein